MHNNGKPFHIATVAIDTAFFKVSPDFGALFLVYDLSSSGMSFESPWRTAVIVNFPIFTFMTQ